MLPGAVLGVLMARVFLQQFETNSISFDFVLRSRSLVVSIALVLVSALIAQGPGLRSLRRMEIAQVVRERSE